MSTPDDNEPKVLVCSDCFRDRGLRATAVTKGHQEAGLCRHCGSKGGIKLDEPELEELCWTYFVRGSTPTGRGIFAPQIQVNRCREESDHFGTEALNRDIDFLREKFGIFCFHYGPPLWQFGKPCNEAGIVEWSDEGFDYIIQSCKERQLTPNDILYRVQLNVPENELRPHRFCSPPAPFRKQLWRFDSEEMPICYAAFDLETCLHESRVTLRDDIFVAALSPTRALRLLDLSSCETLISTTPFEDPRIWLTSLLYDSEDSYETCRRLAKYIERKAFNGFVYTSFFQQATERPHLNVAIFGTPIVSELLQVVALNKARLNNMAYDWQYGPVVFTSSGHDS